MRNCLKNMIISIQNAQMSKKVFILQNRKKINEIFLNILWDEGFILGYKTLSTNPKKLKIFLKYYQGKPAINLLKFVSKPGKKIYYSVKQIWKIDSNKVFIILFTNKGLKPINECKKLKISGEPFVIVN